MNQKKKKYYDFSIHSVTISFYVWAHAHFHRISHCSQEVPNWIWMGKHSAYYLQCAVCALIKMHDQCECELWIDKVYVFSATHATLKIGKFRSCYMSQFGLNKICIRNMYLPRTHIHLDDRDENPWRNCRYVYGKKMRLTKLHGNVIESGAFATLILCFCCWCCPWKQTDRRVQHIVSLWKISLQLRW